MDAAGGNEVFRCLPHLPRYFPVNDPHGTAPYPAFLGHPGTDSKEVRDGPCKRRAREREFEEHVRSWPRAVMQVRSRNLHPGALNHTRVTGGR